MTAEVLRLNANMGDIHVTREPAILTALGLGSCIGLTVMCPRTRVAGMIHIMLPAAFAGRPMDKVGKYADTGIVELMDQMRAAGAGPSLVWAYAGGAQVFQLGKGQGLEIGRRNAEAVAQHLAD
ncbi:MAG: chemotaxis protein CheD, partial [Fimbriimonadaceae bacterium]|nr:chemotaxis protein CheD [Fimbriimonadaceae bacterium]